MKTIMKIVTVLAVVILVASIGMAIWQYGQGRWWGDKLTTTPDIAPRQELYNKFFQSIDFPDQATAIATGGKITITWQRLPNIAAGDSFFFKIVDPQRSIFVSETVPQMFNGVDGAALVAPSSAGNYELWLYVVTGGEEGLAAVAPITVK